MKLANIQCTVDEAIQALCNHIPKPPWSCGTEPSSAPRQKHNSSNPLSIWVGYSVQNYRHLLAEALKVCAPCPLVYAREVKDLEWLRDNEPGAKLIAENKAVAEYYSIGTHVACIDRAYSYACENRERLEGWLTRPASNLPLALKYWPSQRASR